MAASSGSPSRYSGALTFRSVAFSCDISVILLSFVGALMRVASVRSSFSCLFVSLALRNAAFLALAGSFAFLLLIGS